MRTSVILDVNPDPEALDWEQDLPRIETSVIGCCGPDHVNSRPLLEGKPCAEIEQQVRWAHLLDLVEVFTPPIGPATLDVFAAEVEPGTNS